MVKRYAKRAAAPTTPVLAALAATLLASSCDFLMSAFPQGYANAYVASADPRIEASVLVKDLDEPFGLAVAPDGRVFVIDRAGVTEYDAKLGFVRRYLADPVAGIDKNETELGPEEWQVTATDGGTARLYGSRSGVALYLFPDGARVLTVNHSRNPYSYITEGASFDVSPVVFPSDPDSPIWLTNYTIQATAFFSQASNALYAVDIDFTEGTSNDLMSYRLSLYYETAPSAPTKTDFRLSLLTSPLPDYYRFGRLFVYDAIIVLVSGNGSGIHDYRARTMVYDRNVGLEPIALFDTEQAITAPSNEALYVLARRGDDSAWLYRMRWLP